MEHTKLRSISVTVVAMQNCRWTLSSWWLQVDKQTGSQSFRQANNKLNSTIVKIFSYERNKIFIFNNFVAVVIILAAVATATAVERYKIQIYIAKNLNMHKMKFYATHVMAN